MPSPNNPKSSAQLVREHSTARYLCASDRILGLFHRRALRRSAVEQQAKKYR